MSTSGEKVPSCQRSEGSPSSEYEVSLELPTAPRFLGLSWRQLDARTASALDLALRPPATLPEPHCSLGLGGGGPLSLSLPVPPRLPVFPSGGFSLHCFLPWFVAAPASVPRSLEPSRRRTHLPLSLRVLGLGSVPRSQPSPLHPDSCVCEGGRPSPAPPFLNPGCLPADPLLRLSLPGPAVCMAHAASGERLTPSDSCGSASRCVPPRPPRARVTGQGPGAPGCQVAEADVGPWGPTCGAATSQPRHPLPTLAGMHARSQGVLRGAAAGVLKMSGTALGREVFPYFCSL